MALTPIPARFAHYIYGAVQAAITTAVATGIATFQAMGLDADFWGHWLISWCVAWVTMLPVVILIAPVIQRAVLALTAPSVVADISRKQK